MGGLYEGITSVKAQGIRIQDPVPYGKRKLSNIQRSVASKVAKTLTIPNCDAILNPPEEKKCTECKDLTVLMSQLKIKCSEASRLEKVRLLTLVPDSWTIQKTAEEFEVS